MRPDERRIPPPPGWMALSEFVALADEANAPPLIVKAGTVRCWLDEFLCRPLSSDPGGHPVCPGFAASAAEDMVFVAVDASDRLSLAELLEVLLHEKSVYLELRRTLPAEHQALLGLLLLFPALDASCHRSLDDAKSRLEPAFDREGLAARGFYPGHPDRSLRDPSVHVAQSSVPAFGIRPLMSHDGLPWVEFKAARQGVAGG